MWRTLLIGIWLGWLSIPFNLAATTEGGHKRVTQPALFTTQLPYALPQQLAAVNAQNKQGLVLFFTHADCPLCQYMHDIVLAHASVTAFYPVHFLVLPVPISDSETLVNFQGETVTTATLAQQFAVTKAMLPTTIFLDAQGHPLYRFQGYTQQPEEFIWLGKFVLKGGYQDNTFETYRQQKHRAIAEKAASDGNADAFFDMTFGDLPEELAAAKADNQQGILLFFEMENCPFCKRMRQTVLSQPEVQAFYRQHFKAFSIDILSDVEIIDFSGEAMTSKHFSQQQNRVRATPVLIFFDLAGEPIYRYSGLIADPRSFIWLGEYVLAGLYETHSFTDFKKQKMQ